MIDYSWVKAGMVVSLCGEMWKELRHHTKVVLKVAHGKETKVVFRDEDDLLLSYTLVKGYEIKKLDETDMDGVPQREVNLSEETMVELSEMIIKKLKDIDIYWKH